MSNKNQTKKIKNKSNIKNIKCKHCNSKAFIKKGMQYNKTGNKQRYKCKKCRKEFVSGDSRYNLKKYPLKLREQVIRAYLSKTSIRGLEYTFDIHNSLISKWIKSCGKKLEDMQNRISKYNRTPRNIDIVEIDELFTYIKKNL